MSQHLVKVFNVKYVYCSLLAMTFQVYLSFWMVASIYPRDVKIRAQVLYDRPPLIFQPSNKTSSTNDGESAPQLLLLIL